MSKQKDNLRKIVALKRQSAEQKVRALQIEASRIENTINDLLAGLNTANPVKFGYEAHSLAETYGHTARVLADIRRHSAALAAKNEDLHAARESLKRVFHSEERLNQGD